MEIFTFNNIISYVNSIFDIDHIINYDRSKLSIGITPIYFKKLNEDCKWKLKFYFNKFHENNCYLFNEDGNFSELNFPEDKVKYENYLKGEKEKQEKEENERKIQMEKEKFHIKVLSNIPELRIDKQVNNREDFLEVFNNKKFMHHLYMYVNILDEYATGEEILEVLKAKIAKYLPMSEDSVIGIYQLLELMEKKGFYDYDINYKAKTFEEEDIITLPYYLLVYCNNTGLKTLYKVISDFKFDLNKPLLDGNYGPLPFHAIDLLPDFENEFPRFMKLCVEKGYNMHNTEFIDTIGKNITIIDVMYKSGNPELAEELKKLVV